ncbi:ABC-2 transporter permease [Amycolatopsis azurea]|uniref:ABC transporter permease n=1 Tax=Amycolatopsis azurea DSM 43854 TaxID=1238180 RepID=M2Q360_9PSEU|nr:ABC transporter permease subunit [Amycolatopsis azurea]EMD26380.1 putative transmembrane transport protein [Amycolatopsis azurea DSM 43854]OOC02386.1 ABC transporter permease [Amycolatopsis azurea DSM 43854]
MIWLTWRQFRLPAATVFGALAVLALVLAVTGPAISGEYTTGIATCAGDVSACDAFVERFLNDHQNTFLAVTALVLLLPALIGLFWGAPLFTRELETGTHRLIWNQSVTRTKWLAVKLGITGVAAMLAGGLGSLAVTWWARTFEQAAVKDFPRLSAMVFDARGVVPVAYSAFAFALGVTIGMLVRRSLPAMAVTLAAFAVLQVAVPIVVRPHLLPAIDATVALSPSTVDGIGRNPNTGVMHFEAKAPDPGGWLLSGETVDASGKVVEDVTMPTSTGPCSPSVPPGGRTAEADPMDLCLAEITRLGYRQHLVYHPPTRFWPFQWLESALYLVLALGLAGFCFWWIRRRLA